MSRSRESIQSFMEGNLVVGNRNCKNTKILMRDLKKLLKSLRTLNQC